MIDLADIHGVRGTFNALVENANTFPLGDGIPAMASTLGIDGDALNCLLVSLLGDDILDRALSGDRNALDAVNATIQGFFLGVMVGRLDTDRATV